ncbi:MAG: hypothetical protein QM651_02860, partial [Rhodoblastus sp.]
MKSLKLALLAGALAFSAPALAAGPCPQGNGSMVTASAAKPEAGNTAVTASAAKPEAGNTAVTA